MYEQQRLKECEYILTDSGAKLLLVSRERIYDKVGASVYRKTCVCVCIGVYICTRECRGVGAWVPVGESDGKARPLPFSCPDLCGAPHLFTHRKAYW
jgi:hypothetical protein